MLAGKAFFFGVVVDVDDPAMHVIGRVQKFRVRPVAPDAMAGGEVEPFSQLLGGSLGEGSPEDVVPVGVPGDDQMGVISQNGAGVDFVVEVRRDRGEGAGDFVAHFLVEPDDFLFQQRLGMVVKCSEFISVGLDAFSSRVDVAEVFEDFVADGVRPAAAEVVGEPVCVTHQHQVVGDDDAAMGAGIEHGTQCKRLFLVREVGVAVIVRMCCSRWGAGSRFASSRGIPAK